MLAFVPALVHHVHPAALASPFSHPQQQLNLADYDFILAQAAREPAIFRNTGHAHQRHSLALLDDIALAEFAAQSHRKRARRQQEEADRRRRQRERELYLYTLRVHRQRALEKAAWLRQQQLQRLTAEAEAREREREHLRRQELARRREVELFQLEAELARFIRAFQMPAQHLQPSHHAVSNFLFKHLPPILTGFASARSRQTRFASASVP
jgi:hypothetical protein